MAVHIKLIKNNIKSSSSYGKYFAKAVSQGEVSLKEIAEEACRNSGFSEGSVVGVVTELQNILKEKLRDFPVLAVSVSVWRASVSMIRRTSISVVTSPVSFVGSSLQAVALRIAISSTTSATVSRPSGRKERDRVCFSLPE